MRVVDTFLSWIKLLSFRSKRAEFYTDVAKAIEMKEPLVKFCEAELAIARAKHTSNSSRAYALRVMLRHLRTGDEILISKTLGRVMPASDKVLLVAVDQSSDAPATLRALARAIRDQQEAKATLFKSLLTPIILLPGLAVLAWVLSTKSIPIIVKVAPPEVWTPYNAAVRSVADAIRQFGLALIVSTGAFIGAFSYYLPRSTHKFRLKIERMNPKLAVWLTPIAPWILPLSIYRDFQAGMLLSALAVLLQTNKTLKEALEVIRSNSSPWMRLHIRRILRHLDENPTEPAKAFSKGLLSASIQARLATMIRNTKFETVLINVGTTGTEEVRKVVAKNAWVLNIIFLGLTSVLVLFLYSGQMIISAKMKEEMDPVKRTQRMMEKKQGVKLSH